MTKRKMKFEKGKSSKIRKRQKKKNKVIVQERGIIIDIPLYTIDTLYLFH